MPPNPVLPTGMGCGIGIGIGGWLPIIPIGIGIPFILATCSYIWRSSASLFNYSGVFATGSGFFFF